MTHRFVVFAFVVLLVGSLPAGVAGAALGTGGDSTPSHTVEAAAASSGDAEDVLYRTTTLRHLPEQPGTFETEKRFQIPDAVVDLEIGLDSRAEIETADGFEEADDGTLRWTSETDEPVVRFTMPANRTGDVGHHAADGPRMHDRAGAGRLQLRRHRRVGIVQVPGIDITLRQTESVGHDETVTVDGPGRPAATSPFRRGRRTPDGVPWRDDQGDRPEAADLEEDPADVLETLAYASQRLDVRAVSEGRSSSPSRPTSTGGQRASSTARRRLGRRRRLTRGSGERLASRVRSRSPGLRRGRLGRSHGNRVADRGQPGTTPVSSRSNGDRSSSTSSVATSRPANGRRTPTASSSIPTPGRTTERTT